MLMPKKVKFRKSHRGRMSGKATRGAELSFGEFGLQALEPCWLTARQLEAGRVTITRFMKRRGKLWVRSFPWKPVTKKPTEVRMGKGKGDPEFWVDVIRPGKIIYELEGVSGPSPRRPWSWRPASCRSRPGSYPAKVEN